jgi:predicted RNA-binding protein YlqC (UPF0109 family)
MNNFIESYCKLIVNNKDDISVQSKMIDESFCEITVFANEEDIGKLIGKNGNMINSLRTILNGCKSKDNISYKIQIEKK